MSGNHSTKYVKIGVASAATGLSIKVLRTAVARGKISCRYSPLSNTRLFNLETLFHETGFAKEEGPSQNGDFSGIAILVRTSTASKEQKRSIQAQLDRVKVAVSEEYGNRRFWATLQIDVSRCRLSRTEFLERQAAYGSTSITTRR